MMRAVFALLFTLIALPGWASDHIDGPDTKKNASTDISDLFAFPGANGTSLVLALNFFPVAPSDAEPVDGARYTFVIRKAFPAGDRFRTGAEMRLTCTFQTARHPHIVRCANPSDLAFGSMVAEDSADWDGAFPIFFGLRSDPFFFDADWSQAVSIDGELPPPGGDNTMSSLNMLSIVIELDRNLVFGGDFKLLAVAAYSEFRKDPGQKSVQHDRIGRPEITNVTLVTPKDAEDLRDAFNAEKPFSKPLRGDDYRARVAGNIAFYDALDGKTNWADQDIKTWAALLIEDFLVVDIAAPCKRDAFLDIEWAFLRGRPHKSCGGRKFTDDIMDRLYGLYINYDGGPVSDGVNAPDKTPLAEFPYLAAPNSGFLPWIKQKLSERAVR